MEEDKVNQAEEVTAAQVISGEEVLNEVLISFTCYAGRLRRELSYWQKRAKEESDRKNQHSDTLCAISKELQRIGYEAIESRLPECVGRLVKDYRAELTNGQSEEDPNDREDPEPLPDSYH